MTSDTSKSVRISVFNCEWRQSHSADASAIRKLVLQGQTDIICLTEVYKDFFGEMGHTIECSPDYGYPVTEGRRKVMLWSRNPWTSVDAVVDDGLPAGRIVSGTTRTPLGELKAIGVCIPWSRAHVDTGRRDRTLWQDHIAYLAALERHVSANITNAIVLGDFNQRVPRKYQTDQAYEALEKALLGKVDIATAGIISSLNRQSIDHVCHSRDLVCQHVAGLSNVSKTGQRISDHFGVSVKLASRTISEP